MTLRLLIAAFVLSLLAACSGDEPKVPVADTAPSTDPAPAPATEVTEPEEAAAEVADEAPATVRDETIVLAEADSDEPAEWQFEAGRHYKRLASAQGTSSAPDQIEVAVVFWYGCPHCYQLDPQIVSWKNTQEEDVSFVRIPVMWNPTNQLHARAFYTAEALGVVEQFHTAMFRAMHTGSRKTMASEGAIRDLFSELGVSEDDFDKTFGSFAVNGKLQKAERFTQRYQVASVPLLVVNGKYTTDAPGIKTYEMMLEVVDELVAKERSEL